MATPSHETLSFSAQTFKRLFPAEYARKCLQSNVRVDGRSIEATRTAQLQTNVVHTAASSSLVKLGKTSVLTAIKLAVGTPAVATPDQGEIAIQVHLTPLCSNRFSVGRPSEEAQSIGSQLTRIVLGYVDAVGLDVPVSRVVEMEDLSIAKGQSTWKLMVDVFCVNHDGNVLDAALASVMAALQTLKLPATSINEADNVVSIVPDGDTMPLCVRFGAYATSFAVVDSTVLIDPTSEEEDLASAVLSIAFTTEGQICGVHKAGGTIVAPDVMQHCMQIAKQNATVLAKLVDAST